MTDLFHRSYQPKIRRNSRAQVSRRARAASRSRASRAVRGVRSAPRTTSSMRVALRERLSQASFTRRQLVAGAAGVVGIVAAVATGGVVVKRLTAKPVTTPEPAVVDQNAAIAILDFNEAADQNHQQKASYTLALGSTMSVRDDTWACVLTRNEQARPLSYASVLNLKTGEIYRVLDGAVMLGSDSDLFEVHATNSLIAWVEVDYNKGAWALYVDKFGTEKITAANKPILLDSGEADLIPPLFSVFQDTVLWQLEPQSTGALSKENSRAYLWRIGDATASLLIESKGHFGCAPVIDEDGIATIVPRIARDKSSHYTVQAYDLTSRTGEFNPIAQLTMPRNIRPYTAIYAGRTSNATPQGSSLDQNAFAISVEAPYNYGGLLGQMGTFIGSQESGFFALSREPAAEITHAGSCWAIKHRNSMLIIDTAHRVFYRLAAADNALDWGDYPATAGKQSSLVTYAQVKDAATALPLEVVVRVFDLGALEPAQSPEEQPQSSDLQPTAGETFDSSTRTD